MKNRLALIVLLAAAVLPTAAFSQLLEGDEAKEILLTAEVLGQSVDFEEGVIVWTARKDGRLFVCYNLEEDINCEEF